MRPVPEGEVVGQGLVLQPSAIGKNPEEEVAAWLMYDESSVNRTLRDLNTFEGVRGSCESLQCPACEKWQSLRRDMIKGRLVCCNYCNHLFPCDT